VETEDELALSREYPYYDPIHTLPERGQAWWRGQEAQPAGREAQPAAAG